MTPYLLSFAACAAATVHPAQAADFVRTELSRADVDGAQPMEAVISRLVLQPGGTVPAHTHPGDETAYVLVKSRVRLLQQPERDLTPGEVITFPRGLVHGFTNIGKTPLELVTIHIVAKGKPMSEPSRP